MALKDSDLTVIDRFFANKQYDRAIEVLERLQKKSPEAVHLKLKLADAYFLYGRNAKAVEILSEIAEEYAHRGFLSKAIAVQQKIKRIDSSVRIDVEKYTSKRETGFEAAEPKQAKPPQANKTLSILDKLFSNLSREEFDDIYRKFSERNIKTGGIIMEEKEGDTSLFVIVNGSVRVTTEHKGTEVELAVLGDGDFFGEVALLTGRHKTGKVTAVKDCEILELKAKDFQALSDSYPQFRHTLESTLELRARATIEKLLSIESKE